MKKALVFSRGLCIILLTKDDRFVWNQLNYDNSNNFQFPVKFMRHRDKRAKCKQIVHSFTQLSNQTNDNPWYNTATVSKNTFNSSCRRQNQRFEVARPIVYAQGEFHTCE